MELNPLTTTDPRDLGTYEVARLYEDLCPKQETPYKARVRRELEHRIARQLADQKPGYVDGITYRFSVTGGGELMKIRLAIVDPGVWPSGRKKPTGLVASKKINGRRMVS